MLRMFVVYHQRLQPFFYERLSDENLAALTFYKVNETIPFETGLERPIEVLKEYELPIHDPFYQDKAFNEGSLMVHAWRNRLFEGADHVGIVQYDMPLADEHFDYWRGMLARGTPMMAPTLFGVIDPADLHQTYTRSEMFRGFPMAFVLDSLSSHLGISKDDLVGRLTRRSREGQMMPLLNSLILRVDIFEQLVSWIDKVSRPLYEYTLANPDHVNHRGHMSGVVERSVALFLLARVEEGERLANLGVEHIYVPQVHRALFDQA